MRIAFYASSLLSSYWNGAATYYRGLLKALATHGHEIVFYEPDAFDRQKHRDMDEPDWAKVVVWEASPEGLRKAAAEATSADVVVKASGVGYADDALLEAVMGRRPRGRRASVLGRRCPGDAGRDGRRREPRGAPHAARASTP